MKVLKGIGALIAIGGAASFAVGTQVVESQGEFAAVGILAGCLGCLMFAIGRFCES